MIRHRSTTAAKLGLLLLPIVLLAIASQPGSTSAAAPTKLDVFADCFWYSGCMLFIPRDMRGPGDQGVVTYSQQPATGDLRIRVKLHKSGAFNATYRVFLVCGPGHRESCGFVDIGSLTTNSKQSGTSRSLLIPKCAADALISGNPFSTGQQAHIDMQRSHGSSTEDPSIGDTTGGVFVATPLNFDPGIGPPCP